MRVRRTEMREWKKLWLDDVRKPPFGWEWAKTYEEAVKILQGGDVSLCSLDHDLGEEHYVHLQDPHGYEENLKKTTLATGYHVALYMAEQGIHPPFVWVHSMNPTGAEAICSLLNRTRPEGARPVERKSPYELQAGLAERWTSDGAGPVDE
jgi:hypothetical protein